MSPSSMELRRLITEFLWPARSRSIIRSVLCHNNIALSSDLCIGTCKISTQSETGKWSKFNLQDLITDNGTGIPQASLAMAARLVGNMSYTVSVQWVMEILPTAFRASGSSALHMCGYVAIILCPFIVYSERIWSQLPLVIMVVISLISASASLALPETNGQPMPQSLADAEKIIREQSLCGKPENADDEPYNKKSSII